MPLPPGVFFHAFSESSYRLVCCVHFESSHVQHCDLTLYLCLPTQFVDRSTLYFVFVHPSTGAAPWAQLGWKIITRTDVPWDLITPPTDTDLEPESLNQCREPRFFSPSLMVVIMPLGTNKSSAKPRHAQDYQQEYWGQCGLASQVKTKVPCDIILYRN